MIAENVLARADIAYNAGPVRRLRRILHSEWTKLRTVPSTAWLVVAVVASTVTLSAMVTAAINTGQCPTPTECFEDTTKLALTGVWIGQAIVVVLAVLAVTNEYGTRMIRTTLAATPRRATVLLTKAAVVTGTVLAAAALGVAGSLIAGRAILPGNGFTVANGYSPLSLADGPTLRATAGTVVYFGLIALLSFGIGTIIRDTAAAITATLSLLFIFPIIAAFVSDPIWYERLQKFAPMSAGLAIQATENLDQTVIGPWAGLGVLAAYAGAALLGGTILFKIRDA
jgi:ABC-2 type transport system permease protein